MIDKNCDVQVGTHNTPYWVDLHSGHKVCSRHKLQYKNSREDLVLTNGSMVGGMIELMPHQGGGCQEFG